MNPNLFVAGQKTRWKLIRKLGEGETGFVLMIARLMRSKNPMMYARVANIVTKRKPTSKFVLVRGLSTLLSYIHPYPYGHLGAPQKACTCTPAVVTKYQKRISGTMLDRIDIHIEVPRVDYEKLSGNRMGETSKSIRKRVQAARNIQQQHFAGSSSDIIRNANIRVGEIRQFCKLQDEGQSLMRAAMTLFNLTARAYHRILKLARTIADLAGSEEILSAHLAEALQTIRS